MTDTNPPEFEEQPEPVEVSGLDELFFALGDATPDEAIEGSSRRIDKKLRR